jgi:oligoendopeptidase F
MRFYVPSRVYGHSQSLHNRLHYGHCKKIKRFCINKLWMRLLLMFDKIPQDPQTLMAWQWDDYKPYFEDVVAREVNADNIDQWLRDWSTISSALWEAFSRINVATTVDTNDEEAEALKKNFMATIFPEYQKNNFMLNKKLVDSGIVPDGMEIPLRDVRASMQIFREENLPLMTEMSDLATQYNRISGAQTVEWEGEEKTLAQMRPIFKEQDRGKRKDAWMAMQERMRQDRDAMNDIWRQYMDIRKQVASNAGLNDYREYAWLDRNRHDYTPEDALQFCDAIAEVVVPVVAELNAKRKAQLGVDKLRPWDLDVDPLGRDPLTPFVEISDFEDKTVDIFQKVDPELGDYFKTMRDERLLDLGNRKGKAPGGYCTTFPVSKRPFIFMNAVGSDSDVRVLLHEAGHAFHAFSTTDMTYIQQRRAPMEFNEVASMAMELLAMPYISAEGGYYTDAEGARSRMDHLEGILRFWPYMAIVVAFQHWIYSNHETATDPEACDAKWLELWNKYMVGIDISDIEDFVKNRWRRQLHIFRVPFYYIEYGVAQLGAVQVWARALENPQVALSDYRKALKLGGTVTLPQLYEASGVKLAFDAETLGEAVALLKSTLDKLDAQPA